MLLSTPAVSSPYHDGYILEQWAVTIHLFLSFSVRILYQRNMEINQEKYISACCCDKSENENLSHDSHSCESLKGKNSESKKENEGPFNNISKKIHRIKCLVRPFLFFPQPGSWKYSSKKFYNTLAQNLRPTHKSIHS